MWPRPNYADEKPRATGSEPAAPRPLGARDREPLHDTEQALLQQCMRQQGFRLWKVSLDPVPEQREFPCVVDDVKWAREHGCGSDIRQRAERLRTEDPNRRYFEGLSAERRAAAKAALHGRDREGSPSVTLPGGGVARRGGDGDHRAAVPHSRDQRRRGRGRGLGLAAGRQLPRLGRR
ncbi:hypothetical protein [Streptomyces iakyrus]